MMFESRLTTACQILVMLREESARMMAKEGIRPPEEWKSVRMSAQAVADSLGRPKRFPEQVLQQLGRNGVVKGIRGAHDGGYELTDLGKRISFTNLVFTFYPGQAKYAPMFKDLSIEQFLRLHKHETELEAA